MATYLEDRNCNHNEEEHIEKVDGQENVLVKTALEKEISDKQLGPRKKVAFLWITSNTLAANTEIL